MLSMSVRSNSASFSQYPSSTSLGIPPDDRFNLVGDGYIGGIILTGVRPDDVQPLELHAYSPKYIYSVVRVRGYRATMDSHNSPSHLVIRESLMGVPAE
jgi:hypothetical protein